MCSTYIPHMWHVLHMTIFSEYSDFPMALLILCSLPEGGTAISSCGHPIHPPKHQLPLEHSSIFPKSERTALSSVFPRHVVLPISFGHYLSSQLFQCTVPGYVLPCIMRHSTDAMSLQNGIPATTWRIKAEVFSPTNQLKRCEAFVVRDCVDGYVIKPKK